MHAPRLSPALLMALFLPVTIQAQEERQSPAGLPAGAQDEIEQKMPGSRPRSTAAPASCTAAKGNLTLGQTIHPFLGASGSCYQNGVWIDFWIFSAPASTTLRLTFSSESASLATFQDFSTGNILAQSSETCGGLVTSCAFEYRVLTSDQYVVGFASYSTQHYNLTLAVVTGGGSVVNLTPYKPSGWSDKIVVSTGTGTNTDSPSFHPTDTLYVDWAVVNSGTASRPPVNRSASLYVDGTLVQSWSSSSSLDPGYYGYNEDFSIGSLSVGNHTLKITSDPDNEVAESNEGDNEYSRTITVSPVGSGGACTPTSTFLCLSSNRFRVSATWSTTDGRSGQGQTIPLTSDTGHFWFFNASNVELVIKVLDGRAVNNHFWVFYGALSNVQYTITVLDTQTGTSRTYTNPQGSLASVADTTAF